MKFRIFILLVFFAFTIKAQHAYYSSLNQNLLSVNPAFAGTNNKLRTQVITGRTGWAKYGADNMSYYAGADFLAGKHSGLGLSFSSNIYTNSGAFRNTWAVLKEVQVDLSYALHLKINDKIKIVPAFQVSYFQITMNRTLISYEYFKNDGRIEWGGSDIVPSQTKRNMDFSGGLLLYGKRYYVGISVLSITQPDEGLLGVSKRPLTQIYQGKYKFLNPEKFNVDAYGFIKLQEMVQLHKDQIYHKTVSESFVQYGINLNYQMLSIHLAHRLNAVSNYDAVVAGAAINLKGLKIGYNNRCNYGSHLGSVYFNEFYLQYSFGRNKKDEDESSSKAIKLID